MIICYASGFSPYSQERIIHSTAILEIHSYWTSLCLMSIPELVTGRRTFGAVWAAQVTWSTSRANDGDTLKPDGLRLKKIGSKKHIWHDASGDPGQLNSECPLN